MKEDKRKITQKQVETVERLMGLVGVIVEVQRSMIDDVKSGKPHPYAVAVPDEPQGISLVDANGKPKAQNFKLVGMKVPIGILVELDKAFAFARQEGWRCETPEGVQVVKANPMPKERGDD